MVEDDHVIVVVEGPSAAGKTTWCSRHASSLVEEYVPTGTEPDGSDPSAQAAYWTAVNTRRWTRACALEADTGFAVCDSDPLKLHYAWSLSQIGAVPRARLNHELAHARAAFAVGALGLADLVLISIPAQATLRAHRTADTTRRRRSFGLHAQLSEPLRAWYEAVDALEPGRVIWTLPADGIPTGVAEPRARRSDVALLDRLIALLPLP